MSSVKGGKGPASTITIGSNVNPTLAKLLTQEINAGLAQIVAVTPSTSVFVYTPGNLAKPSVGTRFSHLPKHPPSPKTTTNIENGAPTSAGETITLAGKAAGIVLTGTVSARIVGHGSTAHIPLELLVGNEGNDTISGAGGSGTIISGSGANLIHAGSGDMVVYSHGTDVIKGGSGIDNIDAFGSATVTAGSGFTVFTDSGTASSSFSVEGGAGTLMAYSGLGKETFVGGSGVSFLQDTGHGNVDFEVNTGGGSLVVIQGFDQNAGAKDSLSGSFFTRLAQFDTSGGGNSKVTVVGGSAYVQLGHTEVVFIGVNSVSTITGT